MEYLNNKYVSTALGLVLVSNLYEFSPKMPIIIRRYKNNIIVQFIMVFLFCLLLIKDVQDALLISIVYMALFFIMDKLEGFEDDMYPEEHFGDNLEYDTEEEIEHEHFANNSKHHVKQELHHKKVLNSKKHSHKSIKSSKITKSPRNPKKHEKISFSPKNLALLNKNIKHQHKQTKHKKHNHLLEHTHHKEHFGSCSNQSQPLPDLIDQNNISYFDNYSNDFGALQGVEAFEANVMNLNEF